MSGPTRTVWKAFDFASAYAFVVLIRKCPSASIYCIHIFYVDSSGKANMLSYGDIRFNRNESGCK